MEPRRNIKVLLSGATEASVLQATITAHTQENIYRDTHTHRLKHLSINDFKPSLLL